MLAPPSDFGYSPTHAAYHQQQQQMNAQQHQHSDERPKFLTMEQAQHGGMQGMSMMGVHEYHHPMVHHGTPHHHHMTPHAGMTPQHGMPPQHVAAMTPQHHQGGEYDHEPLVMNVAPAAHYYAPMGAHMLLVSSDYEYNSGNSVDGATPKSKNGTKRSREDLNLKEKKRMFKLNDRINQLKDMLEDAGVQTKKNKQSVLDNATYFIEQLRSDLMIAKQKAERAEKEAEQLKANANKSGKGDSNSVFKGCFQLSVTPRVVLDVNMKPITMNAAFQKHSGRDSKYLMKKDNLLSFLSKDTSKLDTIVKKVREQSKPSTVSVEAASAKGVVSVLLMASPVSDETGKTIQIEISLIPVEVETKKEPAAAPAKAAAAPSKEEATTDSDASAESIVL